MSAELVAIAGDPSSLDRVADPGAYIVAVCDHARAWLADLIVHGDIEQLVEAKSTAAVIEKLAAAKKCGRDAELSAAEIVRRAERGIGLAIRKGQEEGRIARLGQNKNYRANGLDVANDDIQTVAGATGMARTDLSAAIYPVTDGVSDERFEEALAEAKAEQNLSRANVVRKVKGETKPTASGRDKSHAAVVERENAVRRMAAEGHTSAQIAAVLGLSYEGVRGIANRIGVVIPADVVVGGRRKKHDPNRIVTTIVHDLEGARIAIGLIDFTDLDRGEIQTWINSLAESIKAIQALKTALAKELNP